MPYYISPPSQNPLSRILAAVFAVVVLVGAFTVGLAALLVVAGIGLIAGIVLWIRISWIKRRMRKSGVNMGAVVDGSRQPGQVIDAEYTVVSETREERNN